MSLNELKAVTVRDFKGAFTAGDEIAGGPVNSATQANNVEYREGSVANRTGFANTAIPSGRQVSAMYNWVVTDPVLSTRNFLLWWAKSVPGDVAGLEYSALDVAPTTYRGFSQAGAEGATFADDPGVRLYVAQYSAGGTGIGPARVGTLNPAFPFSAVLMWDECFARPLTTAEVTITATVAAGGACTTGRHYIAFILERRSGYIGRPGPVSNDAAMTLTPSFFDATTTNRQATISIAPVGGHWPADSVKVHVLMTTSTNPARWLFVPGGTAEAKPSTLPTDGPATVVINISDENLVRGDDATPYLTLLCKSFSGAPPITPNAVFRYSDRMCYCVNDSAYGTGVFISERNNAQAISAAKHFKPFRQHVVNGFELYGVCYVFGQNWTFSLQDNQQTPATWPAPREVDRMVGSPSPHGVYVGIAQGMAWVASKAGLYRFISGRYDVTPTSRYQKEWATIDWSVPSKIQIADDAMNKRVHVMVSGFELFTWDYVEGSDQMNAKFSYDTIGISWQMGSLGIVQNNATKRFELWLAPDFNAFTFRRHMRSTETSAYLDGNGIYPSGYTTAPVLSGKEGFLSLFQAVRMRITGSGTLRIGLQSLDAAQTSVLAPDIVMNGAPGFWYTVRPRALLANDVKVFFQLVNPTAPYTSDHFLVTAIEVLYSQHADIR